MFECPATVRRSRRSSAWLATIVAVCLVQASTAARAEVPQVEGPALTALAAGELGRSTHVAVGSVTELRDVRGLVIAKVKVERWLRGSYSAPLITVMVGGPRPGTDAKRPSLPLLERRTGLTYVLFLVQRDEGEAFSLENRQLIEGLEGLEKVRAVEAQVSLAAIRGFEERARATLHHFLGALEGKGVWTRAHAARELNHLALVRPETFSETARARIAQAASGPASPTVRSWLSQLQRRLEAFPLPTRVDAPSPRLAPAPQPSPGLATGPAPAQDPDEDGESVLARLDARLVESGAEAPAVAVQLLKRLEESRQRVFVVDWLAAAGHAEALPALRASYAHEEDPEVRSAVIRAHGLLGGDADVPWLEARLGNARLVETALLALARLRTQAARKALEAFREQRLKGTEEDQELAEKVLRLLGPAFEEAEGALADRPEPAPAPPLPAAGAPSPR